MEAVILCEFNLPLALQNDNVKKATTGIFT